LDRQWRQAVAERKVFAARGSSGIGGQSSSMQRTGQQVQPAQCDLNTMQVDRNCGPIRCCNCGQTGHMARACPNPRQQQTRLVSAWNSGTNKERDELWRLMMGGGDQAGGSNTTRIEEVPAVQPVTAQTTQTAPRTQNFPFSQ
ncbi:hypothetical protein AMATHDRAFT_165224, partial [Amanita thiersii Skay4041]